VLPRQPVILGQPVTLGKTSYFSAANTRTSRHFFQKARNVDRILLAIDATFHHRGSFYP